MKLDRRSRRRIRVQNALFVVLLVTLTGLLAWVTQAFHFSADWTDSGRNTLSQKSRDVVALLEHPVQATAYIGPSPAQHRQLRQLFARYQRAGAPIRLEFVNPETNPAIARELGIRSGGELILRYDGQEKRLQRIGEQSVTNALAAFSRRQSRWVVFLQGHGERDPNGKANFDLGQFAGRMRDDGFHVQTLNLATSPYIPDNTDLLVLASPRTRYLPGESARIRQYVQAGGNLLWLTEPGTEAELPGLAEDLAVRVRPGVVVDPDAARLLGTERPDFALVRRYGRHPVTQELQQVAILPQAVAIEGSATRGWKQARLLMTGQDSWSETGPVTDAARPQPAAGDTTGPLTLGIAATRGGADGGPGQRVAVIGDGDFLSNSYLGNGANLTLGRRLLKWLIGDDRHVAIAADAPADIAVDLSRAALMVIGIGFLLALPLLFLATGAWVAFRRNRR